MARQRMYTDDQFIAAVSASTSWSQVLKALGMSSCGGGSYKHLQGLAKKLNLDTSHFLGRGWNVGLVFNPSPPRPLETILVSNSSYSSHHLKLRLIKEGIKKHQCEQCRRRKWNKLPIPLELDHINGINNDHRLHNLRILCPNCHSQTSTWCAKNKASVSQSAEESVSNTD